MPTVGGFAAWTERAKDVIVQKLRSHFALLADQNVIKEQPRVLKFGLAGETAAESFVQITTALPHLNQRIPTIAIMSAPGTEKKMGIGRQVVHTYHDPVSGKPMIREIVGGDMNLVIEISSVDTNQRSELTDIVYTFFTMYAEDTAFSFLGDTNPDEFSNVPNNYQLILKAEATLQGETNQARPNGETFEQIYFNRITVPILFLDYVDREGFDVDVCPNPSLLPEDDELFKLRFDVFPLDEPVGVQFVNTDDFEIASGISGIVNGINTNKWNIFVNSSAVVHRIDKTQGAIVGNGSAIFESTDDGQEEGALVNRIAPGVLSGKVRTRFNLTNGDSVLVIVAMMQGTNPLTDDCYHLVVRPSQQVAGNLQQFARLAIVKGPISTGVITPLAEGDRVVIPTGLPLAAQFEWKVDPQRQRIRLRGYITSCQALDFGSLHKRLEVFDNTNAFLTSKGEGVGFRENPDLAGDPGAVIVDDVQVLQEAGISISNPARIG